MTTAARAPAPTRHSRPRRLHGPRRRPKPVPAPQINLSPCSDQTFTLFPKLPIELRIQIWRFATHRRPRVIQLCYEKITREWQAHEPGLGGLPSIIGVSKEARAEALMRYTRVFDTFCDLQEDTVFIGDRIFTLPKYRSALLEMDCMKLFKHIAFSSEVYEDLAIFHREHPTLCESPATLLRKFDQLEHFSIVIPDRGGGNLDDAIILFQIDDDEEQLDLDEDESFEQIVTEGQFVSIDNIHFESAYSSTINWKYFDTHRRFCVESFMKEKAEHSNWIRPKISVLEVCNGLSQIGDFYQWIHDRGDYSGDILEQELADE